jgi:hypothetical protein
MLEQIRRPLRCRALAAVALSVLGACNEHAVAPAGYLELVGAPSRGPPCDAGGGDAVGDLKLEGIDAPALLLVSGAEICDGALVRRELPPGLYSVSWQSAAHDDALARHQPGMLRGPAVVSLFSGQVTRLRVQIEALPAAAASAETESSDVGARRLDPPSACGLGAGLSGAS